MFADSLITMNQKVNKPIILTIATLMAGLCALTIFAQSPDLRADTSDAVFRYIGYVLVLLSVIALAVAAIYGAWKKQALAEAESLARTRKEKLIEKELENTQLRARNIELERENERLEKKNLRLQDDLKNDA